MQEKMFTIKIGDWANDGHGQYENHNVLLKGENLSNEYLQEVYNKNVLDTGVNPFEFCKHYQSYTMAKSDWDSILKHGFTPDDKLETISVSYAVEKDPYLYPFLELIMWFVTNNSNVTWSLVKYAELFGGFNPVIKYADMRPLSAYGLFGLD